MSRPHTYLDPHASFSLVIGFFLVAGVLGAYLGASYLPFLNFLLFMTATMQAHSPTAGFYLWEILDLDSDHRAGLLGSKCLYTVYPGYIV